MEVEPTGPVVTPLRNREALQRDLTLVAALCGLLIPLSIGLYFRSVRAVAFVAAPAVLAVALSYAVAYVAYGYLTTMTSFLVSFVMGNGTNYAIVLLARYQEERRHGHDARVASDRAARALWRSTGIAAVASAASYGSLMVTDFRGFSQFGLIGAAGCLFAWAMTFVVMPALLGVFDRRPPAGARPRAGLMAVLGRAVARRPRAILVAGALVTVVAGAGLTHFRRDAFEYDFGKLSARGIADERTQRFDKEVDALFGRWPQPTVVLADHPGDVEPLRAAIRRADETLPGPPVIGRMLAVEDLLPGSADVQQRKLATLTELRRTIDDPLLEEATAAQRATLARLRPPVDLQVRRAGDLPPLARRSFTEIDGTLGRVLLVYPPEQGLSVYDGRDLLRIASVLQTIPLPDGRQVDTSGTAVVFAAMIRSILRDGPLATVASLVAVAMLVLVRVRPLRDALMFIGGLALGVCWMVGIAGLVGVKITFLNFIALPFIFGVGVEYAIHVVTEYRETGSVRLTVRSAGGPVALCSLSAIVGYGSLLAARNGAPRGLGALATLGELTCLLAAVIVLPAALAAFGRRQA